MELVLLLASLLTSGLVYPCCSDPKSVQVSEPSRSDTVAPGAPTTKYRSLTPPLSPTPTNIEIYHAQKALDDYKKAHPRTVRVLQDKLGSLQEADRAIVNRHLRSESRHLAHALPGMIPEGLD